MPSPRARLGAFVVVLTAAAIAVLVFSPVSQDELRRAFEPFGIAAPLVYLFASAVLVNAFVPGPILAGTGGLLFGTTTGFLVTVTAATLASSLAVITARAAGRAGVEELESPRVKAVEVLLQRYGVGAVVVQRLLPAVPDAPCSYLYGLAGLRVWQVALGTLIGTTPRTFSYTAIGDGIGAGGNTIAVVGVVTLVATATVGTVVGAVVLRRTRRER